MGYYNDEVSFANSPNSTNLDTYKCVVYVRELDKFTNGMSKIELKKVEVISGYKIGSYQNAKIAISSRFCSIKETKDIEWLETEESIKSKRKQKIEKILGKTI